ncbi:MAG: CDP-diacylglycerol--glycerol-3-phosphate 3-phosphatidyltransferase, partial [Clostridia bacterium]|nr:CDP-diacylglycerol--glycerol-3-phosphate 3-phosphatidyltransferase [Clostridia bacterium]
YIAAAAVFAAAALTDFLDGRIARKYGLVTDLGKFLDSSADKVLVLASLIVMAEAHVLPPIAGGICCAVIIAREIMISCLRMVAAAKGVVMAADKLGKWKTVFQDVSIITLLVAFGVFGAEYLNAAYIIGLSLFGVSVALTVVSGIHYLVVNKAVLKEGSDK